MTANDLTLVFFNERVVLLRDFFCIGVEKIPNMDYLCGITDLP